MSHHRPRAEDKPRPRASTDADAAASDTPAPRPIPSPSFKMPPCIDRRRKQRRRRHMRYPRMPTIDTNNKSRIERSPLFTAITRFGTSPGLSRGQTLDKCVSPAGLPPGAESVTKHLQRLYDGLKGPGEENLSREKFEAFVRDVQKDSKQLPTTNEYFTFPEFKCLWWAEFSAAKRPIRPEEKDLDKPISNYFISSSHNTYIEDGNQITGEAKAKQYRKVLESGCRCVEIDVWNGLEADDDESLAPIKTKSTNAKDGSHWSFGSVFSWMKDRCQSAYSTSSPKKLQSKKSEASFKATPPTRARAIFDTMLKREPRVCHAYATYAGDLALHESIPFRTVCQTIKESAFTHGNDLPVIISLEVHADGPQQEKMVEIMKEEWGDLLLDECLPDCLPENRQPTVRDLRNKILIKAKTGSLKDHPRHDGSDAGSIVKGSEVSDCGSSQTGKSKHGETEWRQKGTQKKTICDALKRLAIYTYSPGHFTSFDLEEAKAPAHIYSFGEEKIKSLHREKHNDLFRHNRDFLARTFPESLSSFLSSNPNYPTLFWRKGVQMVALNWQVWDAAMELNDAMFDHEQGWVLKPPGYRSAAGLGGATCCQADVAGKKRMDLTITVLAGQHVPTPDADGDGDDAAAARMNLLAGVNAKGFRPRVTCFLHVESAAERNPRKNISGDDLANKTRTASTEQPDWGAGGSRLHFPAVRHVVEEVSFVRFYVEHRRRGWPDRTAWACIRLDRLREGYRLIKLRTDGGYRSEGVLLVKIEKRLFDEPRRTLSLRRKTWNVCRDEVSQLKSRWSCMS